MISPETTASNWKDLLLGGACTADTWISSPCRGATSFCITTIFLGVGTYGASIGAWQGLEQAGYVAIKLPLIILLTLLINGLLNGVLSQIVGIRTSFTQTTLALLTSFSVFALITGSLSPITLGMAIESPSAHSDQAASTHRILILTHTGIIALAGLVSTTRLYRLLLPYSRSKIAAIRGVACLVAGNLFAGAQVGFLLRPIFGNPGLKIEFLRPDIFEGNFYESVWWAIRNSF
ncbi:MAG: hypothetical protein CMO55_23630 [Verrucomicrobiales bacterium]|nr:hypothetical protein [Verrucomicrobiales bacterium]